MPSLLTETTYTGLAAVVSPVYVQSSVIEQCFTPAQVKPLLLRGETSMQLVHLFSIFLEAVIVIISLLLAIRKKKSYGYAFALTFAIYVVYDLANQFHFSIAPNLLIIIFFVATVSALYSIWRIYRKA